MIWVPDSIYERLRRVPYTKANYNIETINMNKRVFAHLTLKLVRKSVRIVHSNTGVRTDFIVLFVYNIYHVGILKCKRGKEKFTVFICSVF